MNWKAFFIVLFFCIAAMLIINAIEEFSDRNYDGGTYVKACIAIVSFSLCVGLLMDSMLKFSGV